MMHTFESFQKLVDNTIMVEQAHKEMGIEMKRKFESQGQSSNSPPPFWTSTGDTFSP